MVITKSQDGQKLLDVIEYTSGDKNIRIEVLKHKMLWMKFRSVKGEVLFVPNVYKSPEYKSMRRMQKKLHYSMKSICWYSFLTFTFEKIPLEISSRIISGCLNRIAVYRKKVKRYRELDEKIGYKIQYVWKYEEGMLNERPHFHVMFDRYHHLGFKKVVIDVIAGMNIFDYIKHNYGYSIHQAWGLGFVKPIKMKNPKMVSGYLSKYLCKTMDEVEISDPLEKKYIGKRFGTSRRVRRPPKKGFRLVDLVDEETMIMEKIRIKRARAAQEHLILEGNNN